MLICSHQLNTKIEPKTGAISFNSGFAPARQYLKKFGHFVQVFVVINNAAFTHGAYTNVGTLPEGFRPEILVSNIITNSRSSAGAQAFTEVMADGTLRVYQYGDTDATWVNINIIFWVP